MLRKAMLHIHHLYLFGWHDVLDTLQSMYHSFKHAYLAWLQAGKALLGQLSNGPHGDLETPS